MESKDYVAICFGSRSGQANHVRVRGLSEDQEDDLFRAVEKVYGSLLMSDYMQTCEFWVPDFSLEKVCLVVREKLSEMNIPHELEETVSV